MTVIYDVPRGSMDYVKGDELHMGGASGNVQVESESNLADLVGYAPGVLAHTAGWQKVWERKPDGSWAVVKE